MAAGSVEGFDAPLEAEYLQAQLSQHRTLMGTAAALALAMSLVRLGLQLSAHSLTVFLGLQFAVVIAGSAALMWLACSGAFARHYLPWARIIVPLRNIIAAANFAAAAARGESDLLMFMPMMVIGPFFFLGLQPKIAALSGAAATVAFLISAAFSGLPPTLAWHAAIYLPVCLAVCTGASWQLDRRARTAFIEVRAMADLARHDALTGTKNRRVFDEHLGRIWRQAAREQRTIAVLLIDVDHFKAYNDHYGHVAGDAALQAVARSVQSLAHRALDVVARYGGEEFAAVLYDVGNTQARGIAEQMRRAVATLGIEHCGSRTAANLTISIGVAAIQPLTERDSRGAVQLADEALYQAKQHGRNRTELLDDSHYNSMTTGVFRGAAAASG